MDNKFYKSPQPSWLMKQFWKACGADPYLLKRSTYSDQIKYFCLGGIVVATGVMAALAGGYAIYMIFEPKGSALEQGIHTPTLVSAVLFGIIWGLVIFNIDRFIVTSTGKGDGTEAITRQEFKSAIPRIIMGVIIALTISKPIEIRMFKTEIDQALFEKQEKLKRDGKTNKSVKFENDKALLNTEIIELKKEIASAKLDYQKYDNIAVEEWEGRSGTGQSGDGPAYKMKRAEADSYKVIWKTIEAQNNDIIKSKEDLKIEIIHAEKSELDNLVSQANKLDGLLERLKLAHKIAGFWISLFITLLFVVIELTPIFFKMMLIKGPYDFMDDHVRELIRAENAIEVQYDYYQDNKGTERHKIINHIAKKELKEKIATIQAQQELNEKIINKWKEKESKNIDENPDEYTDKA